MHSYVPFCTPVYSSAEVYVTCLTQEYSHALQCTLLHSSVLKRGCIRHMSDTGVLSCTPVSDMHSRVRMYTHAYTGVHVYTWVL
jgi:hypothetical protein